MSGAIGPRLEQYTLRCPQEVLLVTVTWPDATGVAISEEVIIFKGFSSSLTGATNPDPDVPVIPETATLIKTDRLQSPYNPASPQYLQQDLTWAELEILLQAVGC
jgi:hypothetical protein